MAKYGYFRDSIVDDYGRPLSGVTITVKLTGTQNNATLYSDRGITGMANPLTSEADGSFQFYADVANRYDLTFAKTGITFDATDYTDMEVSPMSPNLLYNNENETIEGDWEFAPGSYLIANDLRTSIVTGQVVNGANAVSTTFNTFEAFTASGSKLALWQNNGVTKAYIDKDGRFASNSLMVGSVSANPDTALHVYTGDSGGSATGGALLTIETNGGSYLQFLTPNTTSAGIYFGDPQASNQAIFGFDHNGGVNNFFFSVDGGATNPIKIKSTGQLESTLSTGTAPFVVASTTVVANLNADTVDGYNPGNSSGNIPISNGTVNANLNAEQHNGLKVKVVDIGNWDMDATASVAVAHGLTLAKIRSLSATVRNDADTLYFHMPYIDMSLGVGQSNLYTTSTEVVIIRLAAGLFDNAAYASPPSGNRGWITIWYVP